MDAKFGAKELDFRDMEELARKFPAVNFLLTRQMWGGFGHVLDLMWRLPNIYLDISWIHMRDTFELVRDEFGIQRLIFGLGFKSHYGAAIGALAHSSLSPDEKEAVAHGNLERLLGIDPLPNKLAPEHPLLEQKPLWKSFLAGGRLEGVQTYDAHSHDGPFTRGWYLRDLAFPGKHLDRTMEHISSNGVEKIVMVSESALFGPAVAGNRELSVFLKNIVENCTPTLLSTRISRKKSPKPCWMIFSAAIFRRLQGIAFLLADKDQRSGF